MSGEQLWFKINQTLGNDQIDIKTIPSNSRDPLWFIAYIENGNLYVDNSINHVPSTKMSGRRKISLNDFITVFQYYHRWKKGETHLRQEVRTMSRNTAYIFGLIDKFI